MTFGDVLSQARRYSRVSSSAVLDAQGYQLVNKAVVDFAIDVYGLPTEEYLEIKAEFDLRTEMGFRLTVTGGSNPLSATDIAVTDTDSDNQTGAQVATEIQAQIVAAGASDVTVSWDETDLKFTITDSGATAIDIAVPSSNDYVDATEIIFGTTGEQDGTWEGSFPKGCTLKADLPSDQIHIEYVEWNERPLSYADQFSTLSPEYFGDPVAYYVRGSELYLYPVPNERELFYVRYKYVPAEVSGPTETTAIPTAIPTQYQHALTYLTASRMAYEQQDYEVGDRMWALYNQLKSRYRAQIANQNPSIEPRVIRRSTPRLIT
jgi:hypothetical protein